MIKKLYIIFREFGKQLQRDNIGAYASSISFFFLLSLVPLLIIICSLVGYLPITEADLLGGVLYFCPDFLDDFVSELVKQMFDESMSLLPVSIVVLIWSAGKAMWGLMMGLNNANAVVEHRNAVWIRILASIYSLIMLVALLFSMGMILVGDNFVDTIREQAPSLASFLSGLGKLRFVVVWCVLTLWFIMLYTIVPNKKLKMKYQIPGAIFSAIGWSGFSYCFAIYVDYFHGFNIYGSLSTIVLIMMWLYVCMYILLIGANLNRYFGSIIKMIFRPRDKKLRGR